MPDPATLDQPSPILDRLAATRLHAIPPDSPARGNVESFIARVFAQRYAARVPSYAPNLVALERRGRLVAAAGWRGGATAPLYLERYLDEPVEAAIGRLNGRPVERARIAEASNLAAIQSGDGVRMILAMAEHLDRHGHEWVVFTATRELVGILGRLGLHPLCLARAEPARMGAEASAWGSYYETTPIVVAGRIRLALERSHHA